jgi:hypothetical protein
MRAAKERGEIERFPGGRRSRGLPPLSKDRIIPRAQRAAEKRMAERAMVPRDERPWEELSMGEKLARAADTALDRLYDDILCGKTDLDDPKAKRLLLDAALGVISQQVRVDTTVLASRAMRQSGRELSADEFDQLLAGSNVEVEDEH